MCYEHETSHKGPNCMISFISHVQNMKIYKDGILMCGRTGVMQDDE